MGDFFITIPSTASSHIYPNTQSHFRVQLPQPIELEGAWKIGLSEIHIPILYNNIDETTDSFNIYIDEGLENSRESFIQIPGFSFEGEDWAPHALFIQHILKQIPKEFQDTILLEPPGIHEKGKLVKKSGYEVDMSGELRDMLGIRRDDPTLQIQKIDMLLSFNTISHQGEGLWIKITPPPTSKITRHRLKIQHGLYAKTDHVTQAMTDAMPEEYKRLVYFRNNRDGTITISCKPNIKVKFPSSNHGLGSLLGFKDNKAVLPTLAKGDYAVDLKRGVYGLYIYSNLVQPHVVGDTFAPLLRVIPIQDDDKYASSYVKIYTHPDYYPVMQNRFETNEIDIRSDFGQRLEFRSGKTLVKLSFRKV